MAQKSHSGKKKKNPYQSAAQRQAVKPDGDGGNNGGMFLESRGRHLMILALLAFVVATAILLLAASQPYGSASHRNMMFFAYGITAAAGFALVQSSRFAVKKREIILKSTGLVLIMLGIGSFLATSFAAPIAPI